MDAPGIQFVEAGNEAEYHRVHETASQSLATKNYPTQNMDQLCILERHGLVVENEQKGRQTFGQETIWKVTI